MSNFKIGWAEESIVPDKKVNIPGQLYERISEYVETELTVTGMAVESGDEQAIFVSCDLTSVSNVLLALAREKFASMCDEIDPEKIIVGAIHTHTSVGYGLPRTRREEVLNEFLPENKKYKSIVKETPDVLSKEDALEFLADKIATVAKKAWENRPADWTAFPLQKEKFTMCA